MKIACDWDGTLVDVHTQEWIPGALAALRALCRDHDVFIHTCRANWPEGHASVEAKLASEGLKLEIVGKPFADVYVDDKAEKPDWPVSFTINARHRRGERVRISNPNGIVVY